MNSITVGDRIKVEKGCKARNVHVRDTARVEKVEPLGRDYNFNVKVVLKFLSGFLSGKNIVLFARHPSRLADDVIRLNDGRPEHVIEVRRAPVSTKTAPETIHLFSPTMLFGPTVARPDPDKSGRWLLMNRQKGGYGEFAYPYPSLDVLTTSCNATTGAHGVDKHGSFVQILPKPRA
jgi:hypothetical protein